MRDTATAVTLANVRGSGSLTQAGDATTTLTGITDYTGPTTVTAGTLAFGPDAAGIAASSGFALAGTHAVVLTVVRAGTAGAVSGQPGTPQRYDWRGEVS